MEDSFKEDAEVLLIDSVAVIRVLGGLDPTRIRPHESRDARSTHPRNRRKLGHWITAPFLEVHEKACLLIWTPFFDTLDVSDALNEPGDILVRPVILKN